MEEIYISTTNSALKYLYNLTLNESSFRFRGQSNSEWPLMPSIYRFSNFKRYQTVVFEKQLFEYKPKEVHPPLLHTTFDIEWLMLCQHYGIPTRLLDWTSDILTALYFACSNTSESDNDGALFICNLNNYPNYSSFQENIMEEQKLSFVTTCVINPRMRIQAGSFMLWGHSPLKETNTESYDLWEYVKENSNTFFLEKLIIPQKSKITILHELDEIYSINQKNVYLKDGYLESNYISSFEKTKENVRLYTIYATEAEKLCKSEQVKARALVPYDYRNMLGQTINLSKIG